MKEAVEYPASLWSRLTGAAGQLLRNRVVTLLIINLAFVLGVSRLTPYFLTWANFEVILVNMAMEAIVCAAMVFLLVGGMFDLSVDGVVNMSGVVTGALLNSGWNPIVSVIVGLATGMGVGLVNGLAVTKRRMNPLMTTLGTWWVTQGISLGLTQGINFHQFGERFTQIGFSTPWGVGIPFWYAVVLIPVLYWVYATTKYGYHVRATGGDRRAAKLHGVKVDRVTLIAFIMVGLGAALAGVVFAARSDAASPLMSRGMNLRVIAAAIIGGASLTGGAGSIPGAMLGLLLMNMLTNASVVLGVSAYWQNSIIGLVLLGAVFADSFRRTEASD